MNGTEKIIELANDGYGLKLDSEKIGSLAKYLELILETNKVMNLTAITDPAEAARRHILDSLAVCAYMDMKDSKFIDIGCGAGVPGLVIKIAEKSTDLTLLDSTAKKIAFTRRACAELGIEDVKCVPARAEEYVREKREQFDICTARSVAELNILAELCLPYVRVGGVFCAMKKADSDMEIKSASGAIKKLGGEIKEIKEYVIPGTDTAHRLVEIKKVRTAPGYPRAYARIIGRPL